MKKKSGAIFIILQRFELQVTTAVVGTDRDVPIVLLWGKTRVPGEKVTWFLTRKRNRDRITQPMRFRHNRA